jgi:predicted  nucleic acid-binding Zn-ribbon protein
MVPINHLRNRIDQLSHRAEQVNDALERMRLMQECSELERSIQVHEDQLRREMSEMDAAKVQLHRLRARL